MNIWETELKKLLSEYDTAINEHLPNYEAKYREALANYNRAKATVSELFSIIKSFVRGSPEKLVDIRNSRNTSQLELAKRAELSQSVFSLIEHGVLPSKFETLHKALREYVAIIDNLLSDAAQPSTTLFLRPSQQFNPSDPDAMYQLPSGPPGLKLNKTRFTCPSCQNIDLVSWNEDDSIATCFCSHCTFSKNIKKEEM